MASIPEEWQPSAFDETSSAEVPTRKEPKFWRYYWLLTAGMGFLAVGLAFAQVNADLVVILADLGLLVIGLAPSLIGTVESKVGAALSERIPDYQHQWSAGAKRWLVGHWTMLLFIVVVIIYATQIQRGAAKDLLIVLATLLIIGYLFLICFLLAWRWRRMRLATLARLEELRSFDLVLDPEEIFSELSVVLPIFGGKQRGRCPVLMRRTLGDWTVLLFDWLDINKQPARNEWITVALIGLHQPLPMLHLQPHERVSTAQLHWWHIFLEFPFGLIIFLVSALSHVAKQLKGKPALMIAHSPGLTRGYQLDSYHFTDLQKFLSQQVCQDIMNYVHKKKRFLMVNQEWLLLAGHKKEIAPKKLGELVADAIRLTDLLERSKGSTTPAPPIPAPWESRN